MIVPYILEARMVRLSTSQMNRQTVIGIDGYNQSVTGDVAMTVTCAASDCHHVSLVIITRDRDKQTIEYP